ncbi:MAG: SH3 domain-containing protein [Bacteroidaceae bacterium]|nr:SH3 domain-containing protein [Bacteroidaceae bacterium]
MRLVTLPLIISCIFTTSSYAQQNCKDCITDLYKVLETSHINNINIGDECYSAELLQQGKSNRVISSAIAKANVFCYGNPLDSVVMLDLGDKALYFMVNTEPPRRFNYSDINCIYDGKGRNLLYKDDCMKFPAITNDSESITYVREGPSLKHKVKTVISNNQIFLYTPIWGSNWYEAYSNDGESFVGYIHRKKILPYDKCPLIVKDKMKELMF